MRAAAVINSHASVQEDRTLRGARHVPAHNGERGVEGYIGAAAACRAVLLPPVQSAPLCTHAPAPSWPPHARTHLWMHRGAVAYAWRGHGLKAPRKTISGSVMIRPRALCPPPRTFRRCRRWEPIGGAARQAPYARCGRDRRRRRRSLSVGIALSHTNHNGPLAHAAAPLTPRSRWMRRPSAAQPRARWWTTC